MFPLCLLCCALGGACYIVRRAWLWFLIPFFNWKEDLKKNAIEDSVKWNSDNLDPCTLLNQVYLPSSRIIHSANGQFKCCNDESVSVSSQAKSTNGASADPNIVHLYLSVVIPTFNESVRLPLQLPSTIEYLNRRARLAQFRYEVIIVDDGSTDNTTDVAIQLLNSLECVGGCIRIVQLHDNRGKGFAVRIGVQCSRGDYVLMIDADGATLFSDLEKLEEALMCDDERVCHLEKALADGNNSYGELLDVCGRPLTVRFPDRVLPHPRPRSHFDVAIGSRHCCSDDHIGVEAKRTPFRAFLMHIFHLLVGCIIGSPFKDTQCGFKLFSRSAARALFSSLHINRWAFDVELLVLASKLNYRVVEVPINWEEIPGSKFRPLAAAFPMIRDLLNVKLFYLTGVWTPKEADEQTQELNNNVKQL